MAVLTTTKTNICGGYLVLDYSAGPANEVCLTGTVFSLLKTGYNGGADSFQPGYGYQLYSTARRGQQQASPFCGFGLGWVDNAGTSQITIMPALYGDADLTGYVDITDLSKLLCNWHQSGMAWSQGDFNYDGYVDINDLTKLLYNWHQSGPVSISDIPSATVASIESDSEALALLASHDISISEVPEPSSGVLFLFAALAFVVFRRRLPRA